VVLRQRELRMSPTNIAKRVKKAEDDRPQQRQPEPERYLLQIDRQSKRSFKTPEAARTAALEIKSRFPALQVAIYDSVSRSCTMMDQENAAKRNGRQGVTERRDVGRQP
jgi:hypothetical protein